MSRQIRNLVRYRVRQIMLSLFYFGILKSSTFMYERFAYEISDIMKNRAPLDSSYFNRFT